MNKTSAYDNGNISVVPDDFSGDNIPTTINLYGRLKHGDDTKGSKWSQLVVFTVKESWTTVVVGESVICNSLPIEKLGQPVRCNEEASDGCMVSTLPGDRVVITYRNLDNGNYLYAQVLAG